MSQNDFCSQQTLKKTRCKCKKIKGSSRGKKHQLCLDEKCSHKLNNGLTCKNKRVKDSVNCSIHTINNVIEQDSCAICIESLDESTVRTIKCGHKFHDKCFKQWTKEKTVVECPLCRYVVRKKTNPLRKVALMLEQETGIPVAFILEAIQTTGFSMLLAER